MYSEDWDGPPVELIQAAVEAGDHILALGLMLERISKSAVVALKKEGCKPSMKDGVFAVIHPGPGDVSDKADTASQVFLGTLALSDQLNLLLDELKLSDDSATVAMLAAVLTRSLRLGNHATLLWGEELDLFRLADERLAAKVRAQHGQARAASARVAKWNEAAFAIAEAMCGLTTTYSAETMATKVKAELGDDAPDHRQIVATIRRWRREGKLPPKSQIH